MLSVFLYAQSFHIFKARDNTCNEIYNIIKIPLIL